GCREPRLPFYNVEQHSTIVIQSVDRAARILKALASGPGRLGVSELANHVGLAKTTVHGLLQTLQHHGLVEQDSDSDKYQLGPEEAVLGEVGVASPIFDRHSDAVGAIGVAGPRERVLRRGREQVVSAAVIEAARAISRDLGAPRWPAV